MFLCSRALEKYRRIGRPAGILAGFALLALHSSGTPVESQTRRVPNQPNEDANSARRRFSQEDSIGMVRIAGPGAISEYAGTLTKDFACFSPDGNKFAIILKKGNLETNTNDYTVFLFEVKDLFSHPQPRKLISMSSSSNREGIKDVEWLSDSTTLLFLGQNPGETMQLYALDTRSGIARKLTHHATNLIAFSADSRGQRVVYAAEKVAEPVVSSGTQRDGLVIGNQSLADLLGGTAIDNARDLIVLDTTTERERPLTFSNALHGQLWGDAPMFSLSPDGKQLVVKLNLRDVPSSWHAYRESSLVRTLQRQLPQGALAWVFRYGVIDIDSGRARILLDSPVARSGSEVAWSPDGKSILLTGVFLPVDQPQENPEILLHPFVVEVDLADLEYRRIGDKDMRYLHWDANENMVALESKEAVSGSSIRSRRTFRKRQDHWDEEGSDPMGWNTEPQVHVIAEQDLNTPPRVAVSDPKTGQKAVLMDLDPQLANLELGRVEEIEFRGAGAADVHAGLYFPVGYKPGNKYPLVVQTHGFDPHAFWIDGSFTTAFAAQGLASEGMAVLQIPDRHDASYETPEEAPRMMETIENAIDYVDRMGILDRERMAIIGFSRTGLYAYYMLTHSKVHFRAAVIADASDGGYSQYLQFLDAYPFTASDSESINGAAPFGSGLLYWLRRSPEFLLDTVDTPVMIQVASHESLSMQWAEFKGLRRLGKPVELLYFPTGTHILEKPWDRLSSQQGTIDWCAFWLENKERLNSSTAGKYSRWRTLRDSQTKTSPNPLASQATAP